MHWHTTPIFLKFEGYYVTEEEPEPPSPGDGDPVRVGRRHDWERIKLRPSRDEELWNANRGDDAVDEMKLEWRSQLDLLEVRPESVLGWTNVVFKEWSPGTMFIASPPSVVCFWTSLDRLECSVNLTTR